MDLGKALKYLHRPPIRNEIWIAQVCFVVEEGKRRVGLYHLSPGFFKDYLAAPVSHSIVGPRRG